jgi:hypothetical protein
LEERLLPTLKTLETEPLAVPLKKSCALAGHGHDLAYAKCKDGRWESYLDGGRRMVTMRSIKADMERQIAAQRGGFVPAPYYDRAADRKRRAATKAEERA